MMNCPNCGVIMVWIDGSVLHDPPVKHYECRACQLSVVKYSDGTYDVSPIQPEAQQQE
jgi:hypothetical protein